MNTIMKLHISYTDEKSLTIAFSTKLGTLELVLYILLHEVPHES